MAETLSRPPLVLALDQAVKFPDSNPSAKIRSALGVADGMGVLVAVGIPVTGAVGVEVGVGGVVGVAVAVGWVTVSQSGSALVC